MAIRRVGGVAGTHTLEGPGAFNGARVAVASLVGTVAIMSGNTRLGSIAAGRGVGTGATGGSVGQVNSGPAGPHVQVIMSNAADFVDVDFSGPYG